MSIRGNWALPGDGADRGPLPAPELLKLMFLCVLLVLCGASWFSDPWSPTNSGPAGYLGLGLDFQTGPMLRECCKRHSDKLIACRKEHPDVTPEIKDKEEGAAASEGGWKGFLLQAGRMADTQKVHGSDSTPAPCADEKATVEQCRQASRNAKDVVQLRCVSEVRGMSLACRLAFRIKFLPLAVLLQATSYWECSQQPTVSLETVSLSPPAMPRLVLTVFPSRTQVSVGSDKCKDKHGKMLACAKRVAAWEMRRF